MLSNSHSYTGSAAQLLLLGWSAIAPFDRITWLLEVLPVMVVRGADEFLGTQGYAWDTQADMGFALLGAILAQLAVR